jgi:hypothetical protein
MIWIILAFGAHFISCWIRIRIRNADPDPGGKFNADPSGSGSGSETLVVGPELFIPDTDSILKKYIRRILRDSDVRDSCDGHDSFC